MHCQDLSAPSLLETRPWSLPTTTESSNILLQTTFRPSYIPHLHHFRWWLISLLTVSLLNLCSLAKEMMNYWKKTQRSPKSNLKRKTGMRETNLERKAMVKQTSLITRVSREARKNHLAVVSPTAHMAHMAPGAHITPVVSNGPGGQQGPGG